MRPSDISIKSETEHCDKSGVQMDAGAGAGAGAATARSTTLSNVDVPIPFPDDLLGHVGPIAGNDVGGLPIAELSDRAAPGPSRAGFNAAVQGGASGAQFNSVNVAEGNAHFINSRVANPNYAMFPSYMQAHSLMDPSIQEALSPFFQPFGVDASHLPMTNPPIFQSSLAADSLNPRRRRISISNGQIGQLGEDEDNVESIYYSQPPPMPPQRLSQTIKMEPSNEALRLNSGNADFATRANFQDLQNESKVMDNVIVDPVGNGTAMTKQNSETSSINSNNSMRSTERQTLPGTAAWKKARLLERNRIAASKCRQRKKVAQEQLQKDVVILRNSNKIMKTKLDYYQKLVSKFKRFMELHMESCGGNKDGLTMIEEMLKIDHDLHLDENGNLIEKN